MKPIDKSPEPNPVMTETPIPRSGQDPSSESGHQRRNSFQGETHSGSVSSNTDFFVEAECADVFFFAGHEIEESVSTLAGRKGVRPKIMMPFDSQPPQRKLCLTPEPKDLDVSECLKPQGANCEILIKSAWELN